MSSSPLDPGSCRRAWLQIHPAPSPRTVTADASPTPSRAAQRRMRGPKRSAGSIPPNSTPGGGGERPAGAGQAEEFTGPRADEARNPEPVIQGVAARAAPGADEVQALQADLARR